MPFFLLHHLLFYPHYIINHIAFNLKLYVNSIDLEKLSFVIGSSFLHFFCLGMLQENWKN